MKLGDLIRIYDPDEKKIDGMTFSVLGVLVSIEYKSTNENSHRIYKIYSDGHVATYDEPYWAAEIIN